MVVFRGPGWNHLLSGRIVTGGNFTRITDARFLQNDIQYGEIKYLISLSVSSVSVCVLIDLFGRSPRCTIFLTLPRGERLWINGQFWRRDRVNKSHRVWTVVSVPVVYSLLYPLGNTSRTAYHIVQQ